MLNLGVVSAFMFLVILILYFYRCIASLDQLNYFYLKKN